ncbi:MAG: response regulator transcription factor [Deltaproteobacteria bacterium]|nr:MAG: response regulator transcription factor [Deltaproteobacteria bacterium]
MKRILVVEDEPALQVSLVDNLTFEGYEVVASSRGDEGLELALENPPDLVVLDIMLPGLDGYAVCRRIKEMHPTLPIVMLSARDQSVDVVRGLELGADDYVKKPFAMAELMARVRVALRRVQQTSRPTSYSFGDITIDFEKMTAFRDGKPLSLTTREYRILQVFVEHRGAVVSRDQLLNEVWGYESFPTTRTVDNYIVRLRKVLESEPSEPQWIVSVRGAGYRFLG